MPRSLQLLVIAEGVETKPQLDFLRKIDCEEYQGYLFSKPVPAADFARLLAQDPVAEGVAARVKPIAVEKPKRTRAAKR